MTRPNIVVICLDTVRKDVYDQYATRLQDCVSVRFHEMRAAASWSVPSHAAMITGELPHQSGLHAYNQDFATLNPEETWLSSLDGYRTACVSSNIYASPAFGFDTLFDHCIGVSPSRRLPNGLDVDKHIRSRGPGDGPREFVQEAVRHDYPAESFANGVLFKLHDVSQRLPIKQPFDYGAKSIARAVRTEIMDETQPQFIFANFMDAHGPHAPFRGLDEDLYDCPPSFTSLDFQDWDVNTADEHGGHTDEIETVRQLYAAEVDYLDRVIADLIDTIRDRVDRETVFVITADHGENLAYPADDHLLNHVSSLSEALLHVPFDICSPNHSGDITELASHLDLGTIIHRLKDGESVATCTRETAAAEIAGSGSGLPDGDQEYWDRTQRAVYRDGRKYVQDSLGNTTAYDVSGAPSSQTELSDAESPTGLFESFFEDSISEFALRADSEETTVEVDAATESRLEELGYL